MSDPIADGPWDDYCPSCHAHYLDPCEDGCECESCIKARGDELRLKVLDVTAGEPVEVE